MLDTGPPDGEAQLKQAQQGNRQAVQDLFAWHVPRLRRWARSQASRWPSGSSDYEDLVQNAVLKTLRRLDLLDASRPNEVQGYLRRVIVNLVHDAARQARREPATVPLEDRHALDGHSPSDELSERQVRLACRTAWTRLSQKDRDCILSRLQEGMPYDAIAKRVGMPTANAARVAFGRALVRLCRLMNLADCAAMRAPGPIPQRRGRRRTKSTSTSRP